MSDIRIKYQLPTTREDNKPLPVSQISHVLVLMSADGGANYGEIDQVPAPTAEVLVRELEPGTYNFRLIVVDLQSTPQFSDPVDVQKLIAAAPPNGVTNVVVTVE